jgi:sarcosine oxidase
LGWDANAKGIEVVTEKAVHRADRLIVTAGPWAARFLRDLGIHLSVTRQPLAWLEVGDPNPFRLGIFPCWFIETQRPWGHYGFPVWEGEPRLKFALHRPGRDCLPDDALGSCAEPDEIAALREFASTYFGEAGRGEIRTELCRYTNSPDHHFLVGTHPADSRVVLGAGFSGHGFKFASVMGEVLAELAIHGETRHAIGLLDPGRFAERDSEN